MKSDTATGKGHLNPSFAEGVNGDDHAKVLASNPLYRVVHVQSVLKVSHLVSTTLPTCFLADYPNVREKYMVALQELHQSHEFKCTSAV